MKKFILIICCIFINCNMCYAYGARCELVMDADTGRVLYSKNMNEERLIASTTKIMTALVVINNTDINKTVTVGDEVLKAYGSAIYIKVGEKLTIKDLLYGLILRSGNDAASVLAYETAGSIEGFSVLMNDTAKSIGMHNTIFFNPSGLDEETQNKSTVYDMALLMMEAMKNSIFREITSTKKYTLKTNMNTYEWYNKNKLLTDYEYATGGKIGYTTTAKHTFVSSATKDNKNLIVATFVDSDRFVTHEKLYEEYFNLYDKYTIVDKNNLGIKYKDGYEISVLDSFDMLLKKDEISKVSREVTFYNSENIGYENKIIGSINVNLDGEVYKKINIYGKKISTLKKEKKGLLAYLRRIFRW